jgi:histidinol-phosphate aminotransferase
MRAGQLTDVCRSVVPTLADYDPGMTIEEVERELGIHDVAKLSENENPWGMSPRALEAMTRELPNAFMYPEFGFYDLVNALASANEVDVANIVTGQGAEAIVQLIPQLYVNPGDEVILTDVTYTRYEEASRLMDACLVVVPLRQRCFDLPAIADAITPRTKVIWLCSPNNPTGTVLHREEARAFLDAVPRSICVVFDQAYQEFVDDPDYADGLTFLKEGFDNVIVLRTFSKIHGMAGVRLGYAIAAEEVCTLLHKIKEPFGVNRLAIVAGPASLADGERLAWCAEQNRLGRDYLSGEFARLGLESVPSQANFVLVDVRQDAEDLFERLLRRGIIVRSAAGWGLETFLRVTVGRPEQNERFIRALEEELRGPAQA